MRAGARGSRFTSPVRERKWPPDIPYNLRQIIDDFSLDSVKPDGQALNDSHELTGKRRF